ncbi:MAG TPA: hypothetical protein VMS11_10220, partial [Solirubrobacterales bacterium]|nr:hypothetical protein [Solirubrobacterales bacterium]
MASPVESIQNAVKFPLALLCTLALGAVALLAFATSAQASATRVHQSSFGSFTKPEAIAVDQGSGDLYVIDAGAGTISRFEANGDPDPFTATAGYITGNELTGTDSGALGLGAESENQIAIAPPGSPAGTAGDIYVAAVGAGIDVFAPSGEYLGRIDNIEGTDAAPFGYVCGVATDPAGNLYVGDYSNGIYKYVPTANPPTNADFDSQLSGFSGHCNIAAGATKVYASAWAGGSLTSYPSSLFPGDQKAEDASTAGTTIEDENGPVSSRTAGVDPSNDHVLVDEGNQVAEFDAVGNLVARFGAGEISGSWGVAVKGGGNAYVTDGTGAEFDVFGPLVLLPDVTTGAAVEVHPTTATLAGHIDPGGGPAASCELQYVDDEDFQANGYANADTAACVPAGPFTVAEDVTSTPSSLQAGTVYHYRFASTNANGTAQGADKVLTTPIVELATGAATNLTQQGATLNATLNPGGLALSDCHFEWGTDSTYGHSLSCVPNPGSGSAPVAVHADLSGLSPATPYFFRLVATTANGTADGRLGAFTTQGLVPQASGCPNEAVRLEQHSTALPDCRAYEMVSPADKNGGDIDADTTRTRAAVDGNAIQFTSLIGFGGTGSVTVDNDFMALRKSDGWVSHGITPQQEPLTGNDLITAGLAPRYEGEFSPDLDRGIFLAGSPLNAEDPNVERAVNLYRRDDLRAAGAGSYKLLSPCPACSGPLPINSSLQPRLAGASADFSKVIFESKRNLVAGAEGP